MFGSALAFDGIDDDVTVAHTEALNAYPLTLAAWIKTSSGSGDGMRGIVNKYFDSSYNGWGIVLNDGNLCAEYLRDTSNYVVYPDLSCPPGLSGYNDDQWHHIAFVVDDSGGYFYVDGALKGTIPWTGAPGATTTTESVLIGHYPGSLDPQSSGGHFPGLIDDLRIYNRALGAEEVSWLYRLGGN